MFWKLIDFLNFLFSKKYRLFIKSYNNLVSNQLYCSNCPIRFQCCISPAFYPDIDDTKEDSDDAEK